MWKSINISELNKLHHEFDSRRLANEKFDEFVERVGDWDTTDSIGIVTPEDFEGRFEKKEIEKDFEEFAELWFKGINSQVDFGMTLEEVFEIKSKQEGL